MGRYGTVGLVAAAVHAGILLLIQWISLSLANPIAFLAASFAGYAGHALVTNLLRGDRWQTLCKPLASAPIRSESERLRPACCLDPWAMGAPQAAFRHIDHSNNFQCSDLEPICAIQRTAT